jgi:hypothetical protein
MMKRYLFDHLAKTAGLSVSQFLRDALGKHRVTPNVIGEYKDLLVHYARYDVISAHVDFSPGSILDTRYAHLTILREPIDRAVSWLYFVTVDIAKVAQTREGRNLVDGAREFLSSEGASCAPVVRAHLRDAYMRHFLSLTSIPSHRESIPTKVDRALSVISEYKLIGLYDSLELFIDDLCSEFCLHKRSFPIVNQTTRRPKLEEISKTLRSRLEELTLADTELYRAVKTLVLQKQKGNEASSKVSVSNHKNSDIGVEAECSSKNSLTWNVCVPENAAEILSSSVTGVENAGDLTPGAWARFEFYVKLRMPVGRLLVGIHIYDDSGRRIFGSNSDLLGREFSQVSAGELYVRFDIRLTLAPGIYFAGLAMYDSAPDEDNKLLGWWDRLIDFDIQLQFSDFVGITRLDSKIEVKSPAAVESSQQQPATAPGPLQHLLTTSPLTTGSSTNARCEGLGEGPQEDAAQLSQVEGEMTRLPVELSKLTSENEQLRRQIESLQASMCWRLTWPIRLLHRRVNAFRKHLR